MPRPFLLVSGAIHYPRARLSIRSDEVSNGAILLDPPVAPLSRARTSRKTIAIRSPYPPPHRVVSQSHPFLEWLFDLYSRPHAGRHCQENVVDALHQLNMARFTRRRGLAIAGATALAFAVGIDI